MENKQKLYVYYPTTDSYGIMVIIERFVEACKKNGIDCVFITNLDGRSVTDQIIPYSTPLELINKGFETKLNLMVDAYSYGNLNKIKFYLNKGLFFTYDFAYSVYAYFRAVYEEKRICSKYDNVMLVSREDINYLKRLTKKTPNFLCVPNGVEITDVKPKTKSGKLRLGILSSWASKVSYQENDWFIRSYYKRYAKEHPDVELHIAGRGDYGKRYIDMPQVKYIGSVNDLNDFFCDIDIFLAVNPKGCGILNRVLDAFAHKTIVVGYEKCFSGFRDMKNSYMSFDDYYSFVSSIDYIKTHAMETEEIIDNAYSQMQILYNWDKNYDQFISRVKYIFNFVD